MIESGFLASFSSGFGGIVTGAGVMYLVFKEKITNMGNTNDERHANIKKRLDTHDKELSYIKSYGHCGPCNDLQVERRKFDVAQHGVLQEDINEIKLKVEKLDATLSSCFESLIKEFRKG